MPDSLDWSLLDRHLSGTASAADAEQARAWLAARLEYGEFLSDVTVALTDPDIPAFDAAASWQGVAQRLPNSTTRKEDRRTGWRGWDRVVAGAGIVAMVVLAFGPGKRWMQSASNTRDFQSLVTAPAERATIALSDGSKVTLGPASRLRYPKAFARDRRQVILEGEAVFTVIQSAHAPFVVQAGGVDATVLGTTFNVRKYASDSAVRVTVAEGKVGVADVILASGDQLAVDTRGRTVMTREVNIASVLGWTTGRLTLPGIPLRDAIPELERWYGVYFVVSDQRLLARTVRMVLEHETATEAADLIAFLVHARVHRTGDTLTFMPN